METDELIAIMQAGQNAAEAEYRRRHPEAGAMTALVVSVPISSVLIAEATENPALRESLKSSVTRMMQEAIPRVRWPFEQEYTPEEMGEPQ